MTSRVRRCVAALCGLVVIAVPTGLPSAIADSAGATYGYTPPSDPTYVCPYDDSSTGSGISSINACRAREGIGPLHLPSNYADLTPQQQLFVVFNLERVNRGEAPMVGLNQALNDKAQSGAKADDDPPLPNDATGDWSAVWGANYSVLRALYGWMYYDECTDTKVTGCWGHRDGILLNVDPSEPLVMGAGFVKNGYHGQVDLNSYTGEFVYDYHPDQLTFTWADELKYFDTAPAAEPKGPPSVATLSPTTLSSGGGQTLRVTGKNFFLGPVFAFDGVAATHVQCYGYIDRCWVRIPAHAAGTANLVVTTPEGSSKPVTVTYADPSLFRIGKAQRHIDTPYCVYSLRAKAAVGGVPAKGMHVSFNVTSGNATWGSARMPSPLVRTTNSQGEAQTTLLCAKKPYGPITVVASVPGTADSPTWHVTVN